MQLREYQQNAINGIMSRFDAGDQRTMLVMATGTGKTQCFSFLAKMFHETKRGRTMVLTHRGELLDQACAKLYTVTGVRPDVEKAERWSTETGFAETKSPIVVASVQSLISGPVGDKRMQRFAPNEYGLLIIDETHHIASDSFSAVANYFTQNPNLKMLGVTATPDRLDKKDMGEHFQSVAFEYQLDDAINDGYLVPIRQRRVYIDGLDFSTCRTTAGDVNQGDLEEAMLFEAPLHGVAYATIEIACGLEKDSLRSIAEDPDAEQKFRDMIAGKKPKKTLLFCVTVEHAERLSEIINRWIKDSSDTIHGGLLPDDRADVLKSFHDGEISFLTGVGVPLEGFDEPGIQLISMARPTKSRTVYTQAVGRGTRPADSIASYLGEMATAEDRRNMIALSEKSHVVVLDFVGNSGRHDLVCTADILGSKYDEAVIEAARGAALNGDVDMQEALEKAQEDFEKKKRESEERRKKQAEKRAVEMAAEAARRAQLRGVASYDINDVDSPGYRTGPGVLFAGDAKINVDTGEAGDGSDKVTADQLRWLRDKAKLKGKWLEKVARMGRKAAGALQAEITRGFRERLRTPNQLMFLHSIGYTKQE
jgi:superfamily II DNA or RNA helicase